MRSPLAGLALLEVGLISSVLGVLSQVREHRGWWILAAVATQVIMLGAVIETLRHRGGSTHGTD